VQATTRGTVLQKNTRYEPEAIQVIAYDHPGEPIATETGNNITSVGGRPSCP